jgi:hypothetical protein
LCLPLLAGLIGPGLSRRPATDPNGEPALIDMGGWWVSELVRHLERKGLGLHAVPDSERGRITINAFLTRGEKPWNELARLHKDSASVHQWRGVVYCEQAANPTTFEHRVRFWGDGCTPAAPFIIFGDPDLRKEIRAALAAPAGKAQAPAAHREPGWGKTFRAMIGLRGGPELEAEGRSARTDGRVSPDACEPPGAPPRPAG